MLDDGMVKVRGVRRQMGKGWVGRLARVFVSIGLVVWAKR